MSKNNQDKATKNFVIALLVIIFVCSIILIIKLKVTEHIDNTKQEEISNILDTIVIDDNQVTLEENTGQVKTKRMLQVAELQKQHSDIVGWLEIEDTNIRYPVLQGQDNDYYLDHTYKKEKNANGSIFLDKDYDFSIPSSNLLIYGHRNTKGLMFEDLLKYQDEEFYRNHQTIRFTTANEDATYEIISAFKSRVYYQNEENVFRYYYFVNANDIMEYSEFIRNCKEASLYDTNKIATYGDQLLTLSTCEYSQANGRFAVVAKKVNNK